MRRVCHGRAPMDKGQSKRTGLTCETASIRVMKLFVANDLSGRGSGQVSAKVGTSTGWRRAAARSEPGGLVLQRLVRPAGDRREQQGGRVRTVGGDVGPPSGQRRGGPTGVRG